MKKPLTSIIVAFYNTHYFQWHYTGNCLGTIREHTTLPYELIIINNGSVMPTDLHKKYSDKYIEFKKNVGVAKAWNRGIKEAEGDYIAILNNDIQVYENWLEAFHRCLEHIDLVMATPMYDDAFARAVEAKKRRAEWEKKPIKKTLVDFKDFSCFAVKKDFFKKIGPFDEKFFIYHEDLDLMKRMEKKDWKLKSTKLVNTHHIIGATAYFLPKKEFQKHGAESLSDIMNKNAAYLKRKWEKPKDFSVRTNETGDKVYVIRGKNRHWVRNLETLNKLGFEIGEEKLIKYEELLQFKEGETLNLVKGKAPPPEKKPKRVKQPVLGYKEVATMEDYEEEQKKYDEV